MKKQPVLERITTGVRNLDAIVGGGIPRGGVVVLAGTPGAGKTILAQQICFHNASADRRVIYFNTLSEPSAKTLSYLSQFTFFDEKKLEVGHGRDGRAAMQFVDLGTVLRTEGLEQAADSVMRHVKRVEPSIVVIDSFKVFNDLALSQIELRKFGYELAVKLMAWQVTTFLLGEFSLVEIETHPLFSIVDGLFRLSQREASGEEQRFLQLKKMRGTGHSRDEHSFLISQDGIDVFAPRVTIHRRSQRDRVGEPRRMTTGVGKLDELLGAGIPHGSSLLVAGVAGTGKTVLLLEFLHRGALEGEKGILFSFEETEERLRAAAGGLGWDFDAHIESGLIEIVFIPQPEILVETHLLMMQERVEAHGAARVAIDSVSVFLHKIDHAQIAREKVFQLATIVQNAQAVGLFATDIPYGKEQISRFGVEETVVDGVILLTSKAEGLERQRYIEVYKLRNTNHAKGRHSMAIEPGGITIHPRYTFETIGEEPPRGPTTTRLSSGVLGLDELLGGGFREHSVTLVSGSAGTGKTTMAMQFLLSGGPGEAALFVTFEEDAQQLVASARALSLPLEEACAAGRIEVLHLARDTVRPSQLLSILIGRVEALRARRVVFDGIGRLDDESLSQDALRQIVYALVHRLRTVGATTLMTLESRAMYGMQCVTDRRFSPVADNLLVLRYARIPGEMRPTLTIVKTRGSTHTFATHFLSIGEAGMRIGERAQPVVDEVMDE